MAKMNCRIGKIVWTVAACAISAASLCSAQTTRPSGDAPIDLSKQKTLYVVGYAHLDTQWRWTYPQVIREFIPDTLNNNFALFEKYPDYIFNFSGSRRYEMMKEYYPAEYETLKKYVAEGKWFPCGSSVDEGDCNVPSAESLVRHILYGNHYFRKEFGVASEEFMLPDCFGFTAALPSVEAHCGLLGFSTQKLTWGSANGIPFKVGVWNGPDGRGVIAALDPGGYGSKVTQDLSTNESWLTRINNTGSASGAYADYHYYGTGDRGGAPDANSVQWIEKAVHGNGPVKVVSAKADKMFKDITPEERAKLPVYQGELLLTNHSAGSITSEAYMKRWNRKNELLADAAERASVAAMWLGDAPYPAEKLYKAWVLLLGSQMHDMLPGTSVPKAYEYCWSDECLAGNHFAAVATDAVGAVAKAMDTSAKGKPIVVYNPLSIEREDVVEATIPELQGLPSVIGPDGKEVPSQEIRRDEKGTTILFLAKAPSCGFAVYDVQSSREKVATAGPKIQENSIENEKLRVTISDAGEISSIFDKQANREVLSAPIRLAFLYENPSQYPAWNMDWDDRKNPPRSYVTGNAKMEVVESGPVRSTIEVTRESEGSKIIQRISLSAGAAGDRVEVRSRIDWQTRERSFKATFPFAFGNPLATYDIAVGTMQRGNNEEKKFEVPQHQWFDLTSTDGSYGAAVINDCKYGSDKPDDHTMRLTLLYTPGTRAGFHDQSTQDLGRHDMTYAIAPHAGDWRKGNVAWIAARVNQPLMSFVAKSHEGSLGKTFSLAKVSSDQVEIQAIKKAEDSDEIVIRLKEMTGQAAQNVRITLGHGITAAREVDGQEREIAPTKVEDGALAVDVEPYRLRAFAVKVGSASTRSDAPQSQAAELPYDLDAISLPSNRGDGAFDEDGRTYPGDQIPASITSEGIEFKMGSTADGQKNAVICSGQTIALPANTQRVYLLASSSKGDQAAQFAIGEKTTTLNIQHWSGYIGQWDDRLWVGEVPEAVSYSVDNECGGLLPGYVKPATVAWFSSHRHAKDGNEFYRYSYLFKYALDVPSGATTLKLPSNEYVRVFAVTAVTHPHDEAVAARPLFDTLENHVTSDGPSVSPDPSRRYSDATLVTINHPVYWKAGQIHYTTDGSTPTLESPVYVKPILITRAATIRAKEFSGVGELPRETRAHYNVTDVTPPSVRNVSAMSVLPAVTVAFSEPLAKQSAEDVKNYHFEPAAEVKSAALSDDGRSVALTLAHPLPGSSSVSITGVTDLSGNSVAGEAKSIMLNTPVYLLDSFSASGTGKEEKLGNLPIHANDSWTINLFVKMEKQPDNRTVIAGFGRANQPSADGRGCRPSEFANGLHFWSRNRDVDASVQFDLNKWQMVTATYDGQNAKLYKNGEMIGSRFHPRFANDDGVVRIAPLDPWDQERRFAGEIRNFTIWNTALGQNAINALKQSMPEK
jgi:alpha-mannosidase